MSDDVRRGKGKRVAGTFLVLLTGGLLLESDAWLTASGLLAASLGLLVWGFVEMRDTPSPTRPWDEGWDEEREESDKWEE